MRDTGRVAVPRPSPAGGAEAGPPAKPAKGVTADFGAELATPAGTYEVRADADGATCVATMAGGADGVGADPVDAKPAKGVPADFGVAATVATPEAPPSASAGPVHPAATEGGPSRGRNALAS